MVSKSRIRSLDWIRLKTFLIELIVRAGSGEAEPSLRYAAIESGCWGLPMMH